MASASKAQPVTIRFAIFLEQELQDGRDFFDVEKWKAFARELFQDNPDIKAPGYYFWACAAFLQHCPVEIFDLASDQKLKLDTPRDKSHMCYHVLSMTNMIWQRQWVAKDFQFLQDKNVLETLIAGTAN
jgi:hypothetical protein